MRNDERIKIQTTFTKLHNALVALDKILKLPPLPEDAHIDAAIQRFEFCIELSWKLLRHILIDLGTVTNSPKDVLRQAYASNLIHDEDGWIAMLIDRNQTSHTYDRELAHTIYSHLPAHYALMNQTYKQLYERFGTVEKEN